MSDPLGATCPACLAQPEQPCYSTSSDQTRRVPHRLRGLAAERHLTQCRTCQGIGWTPAGPSRLAAAAQLPGGLVRRVRRWIGSRTWV